MRHARFTDSANTFAILSLEQQLINVDSCIHKQPEGSAGLRYLLSEREIILSKLEALK